MELKSISFKIDIINPANIIIDRLSKISGIQNIGRLFPDDDDDQELSTLYLASAEATIAESIIRQLSNDADIVFAHISQPKKINALLI